MSHRKAPPRPGMFDVHHRIVYSLIVAVATFLGLHWLHPTAQLILAWDAFALTMVVLAWIVIYTKDPYDTRRNARLQDASVTFLFTLVVGAATASLIAVGVLLSTAKKVEGSEAALRVALAVSAVGLSWMLVHTAYALRYAHLFYENAHKVERHAVAGGLMFPGKGSPDYFDFAYFSFVIGMTCQVSDVQISKPSLRRVALVHGLISFAFNTAVLAMFVNIVAGMF